MKKRRDSAFGFRLVSCERVKKVFLRTNARDSMQVRDTTDHLREFEGITQRIQPAWSVGI